MRLGKYHGLGNDFLVALAADNPGLRADPVAARELCDRRRGIGADGLVLGLEPKEQQHDAAMVLLNSDGSEAEISGNGIRCLAQAILRSRGAQASPELTIETAAGMRRLWVVRGDPSGEIWIDVDMGPVRDGPSVSPAAADYGAAHVATVDIGNPHLVLEVEDPAGVELDVDGPALEAAYPGGINVHFVAADASDHLQLRVWERGAGVTDACGSGAAAAVVAATRWGLVENRVTVDMPGGSALVQVLEDAVHLAGPSSFVGEVTVP